MFRELLVNAAAAIAVTFLFLVLMRVLSLLGAFLKRKKAEAEEAGNKALSVAYEMAIQVLEGVTKTTVSQIETTKASTVRKAVKSGEKVYTELTGLSEEAYQEIVAQLSPAVVQALEGCIGNVETLIRNKIEEVLPEIKDKYKALEAGKYLEAGEQPGLPEPQAAG